MRVIRNALLLLGVLGVTASAARAQQVSPPQMQLLLENRQVLGLTSQQVTQIENLRASLMQSNEPLIARFLELRQQWQREQRALRRQRGGQQGQGLQQQLPPLLGRGAQPTARLQAIRLDAQTVRAQIDENNKAAMREVNQLLSRQQRARLREMVQQRRPAPGAGRGGEGAGASGLRSPPPLEG